MGEPENAVVSVVEGVDPVSSEEAPVLVLSLGRHAFRVALADDSNCFVLMDEVSSVYLHDAAKKRVNIIFGCEGHNLEWYKESLLAPLREHGYHTVLVMQHDPSVTPNQMAENFLALSSEVDDFCLFTSGEPKQAWRRSGEFPERVLDSTAYDSLMEAAGLGKWDYFGRPEPTFRKDDLPPATDLDAVLVFYAEAIRRDAE